MQPSATTATEFHVQTGTSSRAISKIAAFVQFLRAWYRRSLLRLLLAELCSLGHRILILREIHAWERRGYKAPDPTVFPSLPTVAGQRLGYIHYTQRLRARFPFLTIVDFALARGAWMDGWESRGGTSDTGHNQNRSRS